MDKEEILNTFLLANIPEIITQEEFDDVKKAIKDLQKENQELKNDINKLQKELNEENLQCSKYSIEFNNLKEKNKQLKDNWNELKEFIVKEYYMYLPLEASTKCVTILIDKMHELEQGSNSDE